MEVVAYIILNNEFYVWDKAAHRVYVNGSIERLPNNWKLTDYGVSIVHSDHGNNMLAVKMQQDFWLAKAIIAQCEKSNK